jgi:hypothetical protein
LELFVTCRESGETLEILNYLSIDDHRGGGLAPDQPGVY